jgi:RIO kinase 1
VKTPESLQALIEDGVIDEVLRPLKSGKEAAVYVVRAGDEIRCA